MKRLAFVIGAIALCVMHGGKANASLLGRHNPGHICERIPDGQNPKAKSGYMIGSIGENVAVFCPSPKI